MTKGEKAGANGLCLAHYSEWIPRAKCTKICPKYHYHHYMQHIFISYYPSSSSSQYYNKLIITLHFSFVLKLTKLNFLT